MMLKEIKELDKHKQLEYKWKLLEKRFDYGWKYFDFHAKQRTTMFNFFILMSGLFANAYLISMKDNYLYFALFISIFGILLTMGFIFIDRRNEELVTFGEDVLRSLEKDILFKDYKREIEWPNRRTFFGVKKAKKTKRQIGIFLREEADIKDIGNSKYSHGKWLLRIHLIIGAFFILATIYTFYEIYKTIIV